MTIALLEGIAVPGTESSRSARRDALTALAAAGWPSRRRERWRYTNLESLADGGFELVPGALDEATLQAARRALADPAFGDAARQLVLLDGRRFKSLGATEIAGLEVVDVERHWNEFTELFVRPISTTQHPLAALNTAFGQDGLWLKLRAGAVFDAPIHLAVIGSQERLAAQPRIVIEAGPGSRATFVQHFLDSGPASQRWTNCVTQLKQAPGSQLALYRSQRHGDGAVHTSLLSAELASDAELTAGYFDLGGKLVRNDVEIVLGGTGARTDLFGLLLAGSAQHIDDHTVIRHAAGATVSAENFRGIIGQRGRGVFNGKVVVEPGCQRIDARQTNDNLLLGEHAEIDTKPELEIYANDVKCSHGSTVGELDADQLFFLRARGLDTIAARRVLTAAFAATVVEQVADARIRERVLEQVNARLAKLTEA